MAPKKGTKTSDPLFPTRPRNYRVGGDILPKGRDLSRFVKWPKYIRLQRQRKVIMTRLKVPPALAQFQKTMDKNQAVELMRLLTKYQPETKAQKTERLEALARAKEAGQEASSPPPGPAIKYGLKHVTNLIEDNEAKLVVIASDVDPIELVVWMPALCRKLKIPYCIVKNKSRLGALVHQKNATCLALTAVSPEDEAQLRNLQETCMAKFNDNKDAFRKWGGGIMGLKTQKRLELRRIALEKELAKKNAARY
uniref:60S ribosomal protein L7a n=1 Tax=Pinguiococcus pyrenoidosus TaxID=172671 RepID=A0A7R9YED1_9STRA